MASSAGLAVQPNKARSGLTSSFQRSYGTVKSSSPSISASGRLATGSVSVHRVQEEDTLQGLAVRYGVTVHQIQKLNNLWDSESIQSRTDIKIPSSFSYSPSSSCNPSPILMSRQNHLKTSSLLDIRSMGRERENGKEAKKAEEEVKVKPKATARSCSPEPFQEKSIASLLSAADLRIAEMQKFNEKLALKTAHLKVPADSYNRPRPPPPASQSPFSSSSSHQSELHSSTADSSLETPDGEVKLSKRDEKRRKKAAKESSDSLSNSRDMIESDIFEL